MEKVYSFLHNRLFDLDQDTHRFIEFEKRRQERKLIMIASESVCPQAVLEAQASAFSNIYAEGYPSLRMSRRERENVLDAKRYLAFHRRYGDRRHYKGCDYVNFIEVLAQWRAALLFAHSDGHISIKPEEIQVNVQSLSGAAANNAVYNAFTRPGDTVMGMALPHGGHLTHGSEFNRSGKLYKIVPYEVDPKTGRIDYDALRKSAHQCKPKMIIAGASAYPWDINWRLLRDIADEVGAILFADIAHPSGLVAAGLFPNPVGYAHVSTMTTHKTLCGPRAAIILTTDEEHAKKIENGVFPGEQGGPHINTIAGLAVAFKLAATEEFKNLMKHVVENAAALAASLKKRGMQLAYGGTNTHLCLVDLNKIKMESGVPLKGDVASNILDICGITCNKNTIPGDITSGDSSAIRFGTTWLSQLGMGLDEMDKIAELIVTVLTHIKTFSIQTGGGSRCRGRIPQDIVNHVRKEVARLTYKQEHPLCPLYPHFYHHGISVAPESQDFPANATVVEKNGVKIVYHRGNAQEEMKAVAENAGIIVNANKGALLIEGERAPHFLSEVVSGDIQNLKQGDGIRTLLLDGKGEAMADVELFLLPKEKEDFPVYLMTTQPHECESIKEWLRDLSDGYVSFDERCVYNKIDGPVMVTDLSETIPPRSSVVLVGARAKEVAEKTMNSITDIPFMGVRKIESDGMSLILIYSGFEGNDGVYEFYLPQQNVAQLVEKIKHGHPVLEIGYGPLDSLREKAGLPGCQGKREAGWETKFPHYIHLKKPYFIGAEALSKKMKIETAKKTHIFEVYQGEARKTPLFETHQKISDRGLVPFAGWQMPILYSSILEEHKTVRETAGLFDVTHMGVLEIKGEGASRYIDLVTTNYATKLRIGQCQYSYLIDPDGTVIDDIMVYRRGPQEFMLVVNASNAEKDLQWMSAVASRSVIIDPDFPDREIDVAPIIRDLRDIDSGDDRKVDIALQGPRSLDILRACAGKDEKVKKMLELNKSTFAEVEIAGIPLLICRSGYTGEDWGFEIYVHPDKVVSLWDLLMEKGKPFGIKPTGLGARDSTRTEAGFPLYGHELAGEFDITPLEAGYGSFVKYHKPFFIGKTVLLKKDKESKNTIVRFEMSGVGIRAVRPGALVVNARGQFVGTVTSCTFVGNKQVGLAYVSRRNAKEGSKLGIFIVPPDKKIKHKPLSELEMGDNFPLHESATIVSRFPLRNTLTAPE